LALAERRRNWFLKRIVIGFAVAALVAPAAAEARVDEGSVAQSSKTATIRTIDYPSAAAREAIKARQLDALQVGNVENDILVARNGSARGRVSIRRVGRPILNGLHQAKSWPRPALTGMTRVLVPGSRSASFFWAQPRSALLAVSARPKPPNG
jgi:hypothetical protein